MDDAVPPLRAKARQSFILALGAHTGAIKDLRGWRHPQGEDCEREGALFELGAGYPFFEMAFAPSSAMLLDLAGVERADAAKAWSTRWHMEAPWLQSWAVFALVVWDAARRCNDANCPHQCNVMRSTDKAALERVASLTPFLALGEPPLLSSMLERLQHFGDEFPKDITQLMPPQHRALVAPLLGPHPLLESKTQFLKRAVTAWDASVDALETEGFKILTPRKLALHSEWLVRFCVLEQTAAVIVRDSDKTDTSTVYKAVEGLAELIDLPIRRHQD